MQPDFIHRADPASLPEWMDEPCSYEDFRQCLVDLAQVNRITLAYRPTLQFLREVVRTRTTLEPLHIVDIGSGGGDMLRLIAEWAKRNHVAAKLTGIDLNPYAARAATEFSPPELGIEWVTDNAYTYVSSQPIDVVISSLFTHHLASAEIVKFLAWSAVTARRGWMVNDLYRSPTAHVLFKALAAGMRWHRFVQHDGPVSIRRSFRVGDWETLCAAADLPADSVEIHRRFPWRLCVSHLRKA